MKKHYCPACESKLSEEFVIDLNICSKCSHIFKNKTVPATHYKTYLNSAHTTGNKDILKLAHYVADYRYDFVKNFKEKGKLLEVGCGHSHFLDTANKDFEVSGADISTPLCEDLSKEYQMHNGTPSEIKDLEQYDVICMFHVLEKMNKPIEELRQLALHLKKDGVIFIEMPALMFVGLEFDPRKIYDGLQTQYFNPMSINEFLKKCGLRIAEQINFWDSDVKSNTLMCLVKDTTDFDNFRANTFKQLSNGRELKWK